MAKIKAMIGEKVISGFKGTLDFYYNMGIPCVRLWPRSPGRRRAPLVEAQWPAFSYAAKEWANLSPEIRHTFEELATGSALTARDMFQRAYLKGLYRYPPPP